MADYLSGYVQQIFFLDHFKLSACASALHRQHVKKTPSSPLSTREAFDSLDKLMRGRSGHTRLLHSTLPCPESDRHSARPYARD